MSGGNLVFYVFVIYLKFKLKRKKNVKTLLIENYNKLEYSHKYSKHTLTKWAILFGRVQWCPYQWAMEVGNHAALVEYHKWFRQQKRSWTQKMQQSSDHSSRDLQHRIQDIFVLSFSLEDHGVKENLKGGRENPKVLWKIIISYYNTTSLLSPTNLKILL